MTFSPARERARSTLCMKQLQCYWEQPKSKVLWEMERDRLEERLKTISGQHALEFTFAPSLIQLSNVRHTIKWVPTREEAQSPSSIVCHPSMIPLEDESMGLVLIHHLLEIIPHPHHLLGEAARITEDSGRLVIVGCQPYGLGAFDRLWFVRHRREQSADNRVLYEHQQWRSINRLRDWLAFVDFEVEQVDYVGYHFANGKRSSWERMCRRLNLPLSRSFILIAKRKKLQGILSRPRFPSRVTFGQSALGIGACRVKRHSDIQLNQFQFTKSESRVR